MAETTGISWTDSTFNIAWGCTKVSPGCKNCYAERDSQFRGFNVWGANAPRRLLSENHWKQPLKWNQAAQATGRRHRVFCSSMCDWAEDHPTIIGLLPRMWKLIRETPWLDWQLLTKRHKRIEQSLPASWCDGWPNVWLGVSIENADYIHRADVLRQIPAAQRFISYEPALGPIDDIDLTGITWLIYGGESGAKGKRRDDRDEWCRGVERACRKYGTAFYRKQGSGARSGMHVEIDGRKIHEFPKPAGHLARLGLFGEAG